MARIQRSIDADFHISLLIHCRFAILSLSIKFLNKITIHYTFNISIAGNLESIPVWAENSEYIASKQQIYSIALESVRVSPSYMAFPVGQESHFI